MTIIEWKGLLETVYVLVLDRNTWNYKTVYKLFTLIDYSEQRKSL